MNITTLKWSSKLHIHVSHIPTYGFTIFSDLDSKKGKLNQLFSELMHDKANKPIGANAFAYAALTLFYIANLVANEENDRNLKFALPFAKII